MLAIGDIVVLTGNPLDEQLEEYLGEYFDIYQKYTITDVSDKIPCGSGLVVKIDGHDDWIDSPWVKLVPEYCPAGFLKINDKFKHVNRNDDTVFVVTKISKHFVIFTSEKGFIEFSIEKNTVIEKVTQ